MFDVCMVEQSSKNTEQGMSNAEALLRYLERNSVDPAVERERRSVIRRDRGNRVATDFKGFQPVTECRPLQLALAGDFPVDE
jgi:hypothetical protein